MEISVITIDDKYNSVFKTLSYALSDHSGMCISERQPSLNFRHRMSQPGYQSDWHVAGDPTLIIVRQGQLALQLRNGERQVFGVGEQFIAADHLPSHVEFSCQHGHRAEVLGDKPFIAIHIKLSDHPVSWHSHQLFI